MWDSKKLTDKDILSDVGLCSAIVKCGTEYHYPDVNKSKTGLLTSWSFYFWGLARRGRQEFRALDQLLYSEYIVEGEFSELQKFFGYSVGDRSFYTLTDKGWSVYNRITDRQRKINQQMAQGRD